MVVCFAIQSACFFFTGIELQHVAQLVESGLPMVLIPIASEWTTNLNQLVL